MAKFSDSPYFLLKGFFLGESESIYGTILKPIIDYQWPVEWTDRDYVTFDDYNGVIWNLRYYFDPNQPNTVNSYLVGMETNIVANGDGIIELWVKETEEPYKQFLPITLRWDRLDDNNFIFSDSGLCNITEGDLITNDTWPITGLRYEFDLYDGECSEYQDIVENNREIYFRKDSIYHEWLTNPRQAPYYYPLARQHATRIRNFVNTDKIFSYFGTIFKNTQNSTEYRIIFDGMKDYVMRAIPEHQRTPNFRKFTEVFFDRHFQEIYNLLKNIWTFLDPMEIDEEFLGYLSKYYHMFDLISPTLLRQREFVRDLIWLLKRKGSYVEFYIIWRAIANTTNALNIYEKWHDKNIIRRLDTHVDDNEWQEFIYVEKPEYRFSKDVGGAGIGWYNRVYGLSGESIVITDPPSAFFNYPVKTNNNAIKGDNYEWSNADISLPVYGTEYDRILSTHYKVEIDVSTEPLLSDAIIDKAMWDELWQYWDYLRPVNRVVDYNILIAPITDFSGCFVELYESGGSVFDKTRLTVDLRTVGGWIGPHLVPDGYWPYCAPSGTLTGESPSGGCTWYVKHTLNSKYLHTMAVDEFYNQIVPDEIEIIDNNTVIMRWDTPTFGYAVLKKAMTWMSGGNTTGSTWIASHHLHTNDMISEVHDKTVTNLKMYGNGINNTGSPSADTLLMDTGDVAQTIVPASSGDFTFYVPSMSGDSASWIEPVTTPQAVWEVPHHLYYRGVMVAVYDWNNNQIHEYEFKLVGIDKAILEFDSPTAGYAVFMPVANFSLQQLIDDFVDMLRNGVTWGAGFALNDLANGESAANGDIAQNEIYETDDFIYINVKLGADVEGLFREFGVYNSHGDLIVYTKNSPIWKPAGTTLVFHFRIKKAVEHTCGSGGISSTETCFNL